MPINCEYDEVSVIKAVATSLDEFYKSLILKLDKINIDSIVKKKNPYLFRAKGMENAAQIVDAILSAFVSSSEETIFGNCFFEPIAVTASKGKKALAEGIDVMVENDDTIYAIAVKSGTSIFNAASLARQKQNFAAANKLANQAKKKFVAIIGYGYGKKKTSDKGIYIELAGKEFWEELTGDKEFYIKLLNYMDNLPEKYITNFKSAYNQASNRLIREFTNKFCGEDGRIKWEQLVAFNSGK